MAGEVSKDITRRILLPKEIVEAHEAGIIHFHDSDYYAQHMHNCDLVNLEDMLQNGTVISGTMIEKPHLLLHCLQHRHPDHRPGSLQPIWWPIHFPHPPGPLRPGEPGEDSGRCGRELREFHVSPAPEIISQVVEERLREEIRRGVQTIQYQVVTLMTTNGQAPFITVFMYLNEAKKRAGKRRTWR